MDRPSVRTNTFVAFVAACAATALYAAGTDRPAFPGWWPFATLLVLATFAESLNTTQRLAARGSVSFVLQFAGVLLFGPFWGAVLIGSSLLLDNLARGGRPAKTIFNVSQGIAAVVVAASVYQLLGGLLPPSYLAASAQLSSSAVQRDLGLFFVFALLYFTLNHLTVGTVIALSSGRAFREVWNLNFRGVIGYDLTASGLAIAMAWLYARFDHWVGFGSLGIILLVLPLAAVRHVYGLYRQLQESGQELLRVMVKAIEARDPYTSGHSVRVSRLSRTIAVELGLPAHDIDQIETAALLHDVGKIHEEFAPLLRKDSRLTPEETALMQTHAARSADLVGIISKFHGSVQFAVRHHHERWDGRGYPDGLGGERIPLGARIILVSDTIDAMTTDRPYRKRLPLDIVIAELQKHRGAQFDPRIVDITISSVAVRRLISDPSQTLLDQQASHSQTRRLSWPTRTIWKVGGA
jgi:hypothetical protein